TRGGDADAFPAGRVGAACGTFDGDGDFVAIPSFDLPTNLTVSLWFNTLYSSQFPLFSTHSGGGYYALELNGDGIDPEPGKVAFTINDDTVDKIVVGKRGGLNDGQWHNVTGVRDAEQIHIYVDGFREGTANIGSYGSVGSSQGYLAKYGNAPTYYRGLLDELAVWSRALGADEIAGNVACGSEAGRTGEYLSEVLDAGGPAIWQSLFWSARGPHTRPVSLDDAGLVAIWRMEDTAEPITNSATAVLNGDEAGVDFGAEGRFGQCLRFSGNDVVSVADPTDVLEPASITVESWVNLEQAADCYVVDKSDGLGTGYVLGMDNEGRAYFDVGGVVAKDELVVAVGKWTHVVGTFDGSDVKIYVDGTLKHVSDGSLVDTSSSEAFLIGRRAGGGAGCVGRIDELAVYNTPLTADETWDRYAAGAMTLKVQARTADTNTFDGVGFIGPDGTTNSYFLAPPGGGLQDVMDLGQFFQFRVVFETEDFLLVPWLNGVRIYQSRYPQSGPTVWPVDLAGFPFLGRLLGFSHDRSFEPSTFIEYQISGDAGISPRWFYWDGGQWAEGTGFPYGLRTSLASEIDTNIDKFYTEHYDKLGGDLRFKAFLVSGGEHPVDLSSVTLEASEGRITVVTPNGEENGDKAWISGTTNVIEWTWAGNVSANLLIEYTLDGPDDLTPDWEEITSTAPKGAGGVGSSIWVTPEFALETNVLVRISDPGDPSIHDVSDEPFSILRRFRIVIPNGGEKWYLGHTNDIVWEASYNLGSLAALYYAADGSNFNFEIEFTADNDNNFSHNTYPWETPWTNKDLLSTNARIMVKKPTGSPTYEDASDDVFTVAGIVVPKPLTAQKISRGTPFDIEWWSVAAGELVAIELSNNSGTTFTNTLFASVTNNPGYNEHEWIVDEPGTDDAVIRVRSLSDGNVVGQSAVFTIGNIDVLAPDGGEIWLMNTTNTILWASGGAGSQVNLFFSTDAGANWIPFDDNPIANSHTYEWTVTHLVSIEGRIRVESFDDTNLWNMSEDNVNFAGVRVTYPDLQSHEMERGVADFFFHDASPESWSGARLEISYDNTGTWEPLHTNWNLGDPFQFTPDYPSRLTKVRVSVNESAPFTDVFDESDFFFTVAGMLIEEPSTGSLYNIGSVHPIKWVTAGADEFADIYYSSGGDFVRITPVLGANNDLVYPGKNSWNWDIDPTLVPSINGRIKVVSGGYEDISPEFTLRGIRIDIPTSNAVWDVGSAQVVHWVVAGIESPARADLDLSLDGGASFPFNLATNYALVDVDFFPWNIDADLDPTVEAVLRMKVTSSSTNIDVGVTAYSDTFTLKGVKVLSPANGDNWQLGTTNDVVFIAAGAGDSAVLSYSADGGSSYEPASIADVSIVDGSNTVPWVIETDREPSTSAVVRVAGAAHVGYSDAFTVGGIKVLRPSEFDIWAVGESNLLQWISVGTVGVNLLELLYEGSSATYTVDTAYAGTELNWRVDSNAVPGGVDAVSNVVLRVRDVGGYEGYSQPFKIVSTPRIEIIAPEPGVYWKVGDTEQIKWIRGGKMDAADFRVFFSKDNFATVDEIYGAITFNTSNNTYSMDWPILDRLGTKRVLVTNVVNELLVDRSQEFDIVGNFEVNFPNGEAGDETLYAQNTYNASWLTKGTVGFVDLYYKAGVNDWVKFASDILDNGDGVVAQPSGAPWTTPLPSNETVWFRVQDSSYTNIFDGITPGPYDDSDDPFPLKWYDVFWLVGYTNSPFHPLDGLSMRDNSLGVARSGLSCKDANGDAQYIAMKYPYGLFTTEWFREFYSRYVDFDWLCNSNMVRLVLMDESDIEPDPRVMADFSYSYSTKTFAILSWLEQGGHILETPDEARVYIYDEVGALVASVTGTTHNAGVFWLNWNASAYSGGQTFFARNEIDLSGSTYSSGQPIQMREAASAEISSVLDAVDGAVSSIVAEVTGVGDGVSNLNENVRAGFSNLNVRVDSASNLLGRIDAGVTGGFSNLNNRADSVSNMLVNIGDSMDDMSNVVITALDRATNVLLEIRGPISNLWDMSTLIWGAASNANQKLKDTDFATILTRPPSVALGSTNTLLYKTMRNFDSSVVELTVTDPTRTVTYFTANMGEIAPGLGIYSNQIVADWGVGNCIVLCTDPMYKDSMVLDVFVDIEDEILPSLMKAVSNDIAVLDAELELVMAAMLDVQTTVADVQTSVDGLGGVDLGNVESGLDDVQTAVDDVQAAVDDMQNDVGDLLGLGQGTDLSGVEDRIKEVENNQDTMFTRLDSILDKVEALGGIAADSATKAQQAKTEVAAVSAAIQSLKELLLAGDTEGSEKRLVEIQAALSSLREKLLQIPKELNLESMYQEIARLTAVVEAMASSQGFEILSQMTGFPTGTGTGVPGGGEDSLLGPEGLAGVVRTLEELKALAAFIQATMEARYNEIVITDGLIPLPDTML
ncbi:MAG: hypothetical protein HQ559_05965, partial [Lentisphaerae bacterium]|nr:hypothetical protein [Lentisphaerota bacterium]